MVPELTLTKPKSDSADSARYWPPLQGEWTYADYTRLPDNGFRYIEVHVLRGQAYAPLGTFGPDETIQSELLPDLQLAVSEICQL